MAKKSISITLCLLFVFMLAACGGGKTDNVTVSIGKSEKFTQAQINDAVKAVEKYFKREFDGCELMVIAYDEAESNREAESYIKSVGGVRGYSAEDVIMLSSDFKTGVETAGDSGLTPNEIYSGWKWFLVKDVLGRWTVTDWGFA